MIKIDENEKIILEKRRHWFILFSKTFFLIFLAFVPFLLFTVSKFINFYIIIIFSALWFLFLWITFFILWTDYYLDILIVTDKRVIDIEQKGLFFREVSTLGLDKIQDIKIEVRGIINTLIDIGDVYIQTAGEQREFIVRGVHNPSAIKDIIRAKYEKTINRLKIVRIEKL